MSENKKTFENKPYKFITKDYKGETEVMVLKGKGRIASLEENIQAGTAQVKFQIFTPGDDPKPLRPESAWFPLENEALHKHLKEAFEAGREVEYRIEIKRRPKIDANIPFLDLYQGMDAARENTIRILALADNIESDEAVTFPADDPQFSYGGIAGKTVSEMQREREATPAAAPALGGGTAVAFDVNTLLSQLATVADADSYPPTLIDSLSALALASGATAEQVNSILYKEGKTGKFQPAQTQQGRIFSVEAPRWEQYNSDGRLNLGSSIVASGISMESAVSRNILNGVDENVNPASLKGFDEVVEYFTHLSYSICDFSQIKVYGAGSRVDRKAESHTRVRGLFIDLLERFYFFPVKVENGTLYITSSKDVDKWVKNIGSTIVKRFVNGITASQTHKSFATLREELSGLPVLDRSDIPTANPQPARQEQESRPEPEPQPVQTQTPPVAPAEPETRSEEPPAADSTAEPVQPAMTQENSSDRASAAADLISNFVPTEGIYTEPSTTDGAIPAETEEGDYEFVTPNVIKLNATNYDGELATSEDVETFKELLDSLGFNLQDRNEQILIGKIIKFTFGDQFRKIQELPSDLIGQFVDWYASAGEEAVNELRQVVSEAYN